MLWGCMSQRGSAFADAAKISVNAIVTILLKVRSRLGRNSGRRHPITDGVRNASDHTRSGSKCHQWAINHHNQ